MANEIIEETIQTPEELKEIPSVEVVNVIRSYEAREKTLKIVDTPDKIVPVETVYNIEEVRARMEKNINARNQWQILIDADQAIIDKFNEIK